MKVCCDLDNLIVFMFWNWLKKHWSEILIVLAVVVACPIIINVVLQVPAFVSVVGNNIDWLSFWGDYLSAIVSSGVALYILYKQYTQNQGENKSNRSLQTAIIVCQSGMDRLSRFVQASSELISAMNPEAVQRLFYMIYSNSKEYMCEISKIYTDVCNKYYAMALLLDSNKLDSSFKYTIREKSKEYVETINELQVIGTILYVNPGMTVPRLILDPELTKALDERTKDILEQCSKESKCEDPNLDYWKVAIRRLASVEKHHFELLTKVEEYVRKEERRINDDLSMVLNPNS